MIDAAMVVSTFVGQPGHRLIEFGIFAAALALIILVPYVIDLLKGTATVGLARATMANAIVVVIALTVALLVIEKPFKAGDPNATACLQPVTSSTPGEAVLSPACRAFRPRSISARWSLMRGSFCEHLRARLDISAWRTPASRWRRSIGGTLH